MIDVDNPDERLRPGMTAVVQLQGVRHNDVTRIPNNALTFRPSTDVLKVIGQPEPSMDGVMASGDDLGIKPRAVWTFDGRQFTPIRVTVGLADDQWAELLKGSVRPGDRLVTRADARRRSRFSSSP